MLRQLYFIGNLLLVFIFISISVSGQENESRARRDSIRPLGGSTMRMCSNDMMLAELRKDPAYKSREDAMNREIREALRSISGDTITVPVVVHIINQNPFSITDAYVIGAIAALNDAYSKAGAFSTSAGVDTKIRFCLSQQDPDGGNTTGITRTQSFFSDDLNMDNEDSRLKDLIQWDPSRYINIWLISNIYGEAYADFKCGQWYRLGVGGYATLPPGGGAADGIVVGGLGATLLAHEMGHYLGLYHSFQGGCANFNCLTDGDMVCDTPPDNSVRPSFACNIPANSCFTDTLSAHSNGNFPLDVPDQIANFMDYGNGACSNQFTQGQADRMRAAIMTQRAGLLIDECTRPCVENILASFTRDQPYPITGTTVNFTNTATGATNFEWSVDGTLMATTSNFSYTFSTNGKFKVTLKAFNTSTCFATATDYVIVTCGVTARFFPNKKTIASLLNVYTDSILFTNTSYNGTSYQWLVSNSAGMAETVVATTTNLTYVFPAPATYYIRLIATTGSCSDTTIAYSVPVSDPTAEGYPFTFFVRCYNQNKVKVSFCLSNDGYAPLPQNTPVNFYDADPTLPGANRLSPTFYLTSEVSGNCDECFTHILNVAYRGLDKIYMVFNDAGTSIPVVLPNASLVEKFYFNNTINSTTIRRTVSASICQGQSYGGHTVAGTYIDTLVSTFTGCDSIRTLYLTVKPVYNTNVNASICQGQSYQGYSTTGTYVNVFTAANGCDSTRTLHLTVKPVSNTTVNASICQGQNYAGHTTSGTYVDVYTASNGCDSTRTLHLTVKPVFNTIVTTAICQGQSYAGHTTSGTYVDVYIAANGCDSTRTLHLTVKPTVSTNITASICQGQNYAGHTTSGNYVDVYTAANGCDSTRALQLTVKPVFNTIVTTSICYGQNYAGHTTSGDYVDVYTAANGCDSTRTLHLTVKPVFNTSVTKSICQGQSYAGHTTSGDYIDIYTAVNGCDSTRTLHLTVNPVKHTTLDISICQGQSYLAGGHMQTTTGVYIDSSHTYLGCDSIIKTNLTVHALPVPQLGSDKRICMGDVWILNPGNFSAYEWQDGTADPTYPVTQVGEYSVTVTNTFGCKASDTAKLLEVFPLPEDFLPADSSLCRGNELLVKVRPYVNYSWSTGSNQQYLNITQSGLYKLLVTDNNGCKGKDSIKVFFYNCKNIQVPNAFSPNADNNNETFKPLIPSPVTNYHMQIWNRAGELLFETRDYLKGWDGTYKSTAQPIGAYVYLITLTDVDGAKVKKQGSLILVR